MSSFPALEVFPQLQSARLEVSTGTRVTSMVTEICDKSEIFVTMGIVRAVRHMLISFKRRFTGEKVAVTQRPMFTLEAPQRGFLAASQAKSHWKSKWWGGADSVRSTIGKKKLRLRSLGTPRRETFSHKTKTSRADAQPSPTHLLWLYSLLRIKSTFFKFNALPAREEIQITTLFPSAAFCTSSEHFNKHFCSLSPLTFISLRADKWISKLRH